ncbi:MAG: hypothetical protein JW832_02500 [Deltaproteobacteria bacterium]|nr:hypothetical protein [Deltaproteobacteria bacterium]
MNHTSHIIRFAVVLVAVIAGFFILRGFLVPDSFGVQGDYKYGYHRGASDAEQAALPALYTGSKKCAQCHAAETAEWQAGKHAGVECETCHGNWQAHNNNTKDKAGKDSSIEACLLCHGEVEARPADFPQIADMKKHVEDGGGAYEKGMLCVACHSAHSPQQ